MITDIRSSLPIRIRTIPSYTQGKVYVNITGWVVSLVCGILRVVDILCGMTHWWYILYGNESKKYCQQKDS